MNHVEKQQQLYKAIEKNFKENFNEQIDFNKENVDKKLKEILIEMVDKYDSLTNFDFDVYYTKLSQLMMARAMFNISLQ